MTKRLWFFARNNQQEGPILESQLRALLSNQTLAPDTLVWADCLENWTPASQVEILSIPPATPALSENSQADYTPALECPVEQTSTLEYPQDWETAVQQEWANQVQTQEAAPQIALEITPTAENSKEITEARGDFAEALSGWASAFASESLQPTEENMAGYSNDGFDSKNLDPGGHGHPDSTLEPKTASGGSGQTEAAGESHSEPEVTVPTVKSTRTLRNSFSATIAKPEAKGRLSFNQPDWKPPETQWTRSIILEDQLPHPWYRLWARCLDTNIASLAGWVAASPFILGFSLTQSIPWLFVGLLAAFSGYLMYEPLCLWKLGTTPGKMCCAIEVKHNDATNLTLAEAGRRTFLMGMRTGLLFPFFPIVAVVLYVVQFRRLSKNKITSWDRDMELVYVHKPFTGTNIGMLVGGFIGISIAHNIVYIALFIALAPMLKSLSPL